MKKSLCGAVAFAAVMLAPPHAAASSDGFTGAWRATDPDDGSTLVADIGAPNAAGIRHLTLVDQFASACDAPAVAIGAGTVSGSTLAATLEVRCGGASLGKDVPFSFQISGDTLHGGGLVFTRVGAS